MNRNDRLRRWLPLAAMTLAAGTAAWAGEAASSDGLDHFEKKIRPVLVEHCYRCHSPEAEKVQGGLLLHSRAAARKGGESGPAVVPGKPAESLLLEALKYESLEMPPDKRLPERVVADFEKWIEDGAADPRDGGGSVSARKIDIEAGRRFWAFQPPQRAKIDSPARSGSRIDALVDARLVEAGLTASEAASRRTLVRRLTFDTIGLPPAPEEVAAFLADDSPAAYDRLVDRLLASPRFGEHWARLWLDVARYAEDQAHIVGNNATLFYPNAYLYRDWVIAAFNDDLPYDQFVKRQLAADLIDSDDEAGHAALGFLGLGPKYYRRGDKAVMADEWEDRVDAVARGLLGLTVACARCHDHKFDPISTEDYYALAGVFAGTKMFNRPLEGKAKGKNGEAKSPKEAMHVVREGTPTDLNVYIRGDVTNPGPKAPRRFIPVLSEGSPAPFSNGSGRLELAEEIVRADNPLTARVIVNRIWARLLGRPLVGTPSNFGALGERPTHPALLDDLAVRFVAAGWSPKWLIREIVASDAYRRSSAATGEQRRADPENRWLARANRRRLSVEQWRDAVLCVSGGVSAELFGPSIDPQDPKVRRRTVYSEVSRFDLNPMLALFDFPDPNVHSARRSRTTTPLQKLFVMNGAFATARAARLAERLLDELPGQENEAARIERAYSLLYARSPADEESEIAAAFLRDCGGSPERAWTQFCQVLLASSEFGFVD